MCFLALPVQFTGLNIKLMGMKFTLSNDAHDYIIVSADDLNKEVCLIVRDNDCHEDAITLLQYPEFLEFYEAVLTPIYNKIKTK